MSHLKVIFTLVLTSQFSTIYTTELCIVEEKPQNSQTPSHKIFNCEKCCELGCCPTTRPPELTLQVGILVVFIMLGYVYMTMHCCRKNFCKSSRVSTASVSISRSNTNPQEINLMLSFNQGRDRLERFHFENLSNAHFPVPLTPGTPITPPPAYVTLTPPPTYNVAIHFPPIYSKGNSKELDTQNVNIIDETNQK